MLVLKKREESDDACQFAAEFSSALSELLILPHTICKETQTSAISTDQVSCASHAHSGTLCLLCCLLASKLPGLSNLMGGLLCKSGYAQ